MYSENLMKQMEAAMPKAAYPSINKSDIENFKIALPNIEEQRKVIESLEGLEKQIKLNQTTINTSADKKRAIIDSYL